MSGSARIVQISVSPDGVPKHPVPSARVTTLGLQGDAQRDRTPGAYLRLGAEMLAQVTRDTAPCLNITASFRYWDYSRVSQTRHPGDSRVYARVLREGSLTNGDPVQLLTEDEASALIGAR